MFYYVVQSPLTAVITLLVTFTCLRFFSKRIMISEFDSFGFLNTNVALSFTLLISIYSLGEVSFEAVREIGSLILSFYIGIYITTLILDANIKLMIRRSCFAKVLFKDNLNKRNIILIGTILIALTSFFSILLVFSGQILDDRIVIAKSYRGIDIIRQGVATIFPYYAIGLFLLTRKKIYPAMILAYGVISFFSGSKSFLLTFVIAYFTMDGLLSGKKTIQQHIQKIYLPLLILAGAVLVKMFWGANLEAALFSIIDRLFGTGDIYYHAYVAGDYRELYGLYNFFSYVFHPFTALVGIRGYEWPLGVELYSMLSGNPVGYGPNAQLPILLLVLLHGNVMLAMFVAMLTGAAVCLSSIYALKLLQNNRIPPFWKIAAFSVLFGSAPTVFIDIGVFEQSLISVIAVTLIISITYELAGFKYSNKIHRI